MVWILLAISSLLLIGLDQWTKWLAVTHLVMGEPVTVIDGVLEWKLNTNDGAAWGIFGGERWLLVTVSVVMLIAVGVIMFGRQFRAYRMANISACLIIAGGIGNLIDRLFRGGEVVDFINTAFMEFPTFNVADCCVVIGAAFLLFFIMFVYKEDNTKPKAKGEDNTDGTNDLDGSSATDGGEA